MVGGENIALNKGKRAMNYLLAAAFIFAASTAKAASGNDLMTACRGYQNNPDWGYCIGYVIAMNDAENSKPRKEFCVPPSVLQSQLARVAVKWMEENPDKLHFSANSLVVAALVKSFPCSK